MLSNISIRPANKEDATNIALFLNNEKFVHRHLDWRTAIDWLDRHPYYLITHNNQILAALACPEDPSGIAWIRLFATSISIHSEKAWQFLFKEAIDFYNETQRHISFAAVALQAWFSDILKQNGFTHHQDIIILERKKQPVINFSNNDHITLRPMWSSDLEIVENVDHSAFMPLWQLSVAGLSAAYRQSSYATVAEFRGEIIGYQISTNTPFTAHLARIGVHQDYQKQHIGQSLLGNMLNYYSQIGFTTVTVNTQNNNQSSIYLYNKFGFKIINEKFPVYSYELNP